MVFFIFCVFPFFFVHFLVFLSLDFVCLFVSLLFALSSLCLSVCLFICLFIDLYLFLSFPIPQLISLSLPPPPSFLFVHLYVLLSIPLHIYCLTFFPSIFHASISIAIDNTEHKNKIQIIFVPNLEIYKTNIPLSGLIRTA